jgi:hypothetical protein
MKILKLVKFDAGISAKGKHRGFNYKIYDGEKVIAARDSMRNYVACYVVERQDEKGNRTFLTPFFFGRPGLIGKGDSKRLDHSDIYGLALIERVKVGTHPKSQIRELIRTRKNAIIGDQIYWHETSFYIDPPRPASIPPGAEFADPEAAAYFGSGTSLAPAPPPTAPKESQSIPLDTGTAMHTIIGAGTDTHPTSECEVRGCVRPGANKLVDKMKLAAIVRPIFDVPQFDVFTESVKIKLSIRLAERLMEASVNWPGTHVVTRRNDPGPIPNSELDLLDYL